jgi:hypothetical protein
MRDFLLRLIRWIRKRGLLPFHHKLREIDEAIAQGKTVLLLSTRSTAVNIPSSRN